MSELATLARPYAEALFKRAKETNSMGNWSQNLAFLSSVLERQDVSVIIENPKLSKQKLSELLLEIAQGQVTAECENFLKLLVDNDRLSLISIITSLFEAYKAEDEGYIEVDVMTAYAFANKKAEQKFAGALEKTLNKKVRMNICVDKSLIGGVLVRAGDRVIDGSIRGRLQQMQKALQ